MINKRGIVKKRNIYNVLFLIILLIYIFVTNKFMTDLRMILSPYLVVLFSIIFFLKSRYKSYHMILSTFVLISNISIVLAEYIFPGLVFTNNYFRTTEIHGIAINILLLFIAIVSIFYNKGKERKQVELLNINTLENSIIFYLILCILVIIMLTGISDRGSFGSYRVAAKSYYGYGIILILLAYKNIGKSIIKKNLLIIFSLIYVLQDLIYGGRKSLFEVSVLLFILFFEKKITYKKVIGISIIGYVVYVIVGVYRLDYSIDNLTVNYIIEMLKNRMFVFDTPVGAYYSSETFIYTSNLLGFGFRIESFLNFIKQIFIGGSSTSGNITRYIRYNIIDNMGGGILPFHFYFWFGWIGVVLIAFLVTFILNLKNDNEFKKCISVIFVCTVSNWFLYTPLVIFRLNLLYLAISYISINILKRMLTYE